MDNKQTPINTDFFDAAFRSKLSDNKEFIPIPNERAKEIFNECVNWHEEIYFPAEKEEEKKLGRPLEYIEQISLYMALKYPL